MVELQQMKQQTQPAGDFSALQKSAVTCCKARSTAGTVGAGC